MTESPKGRFSENVYNFLLHQNKAVKNAFKNFKYERKIFLCNNSKNKIMFD